MEALKASMDGSTRELPFKLPWNFPQLPWKLPRKLLPWKLWKLRHFSTDFFGVLLPGKLVSGSIEAVEDPMKVVQAAIAVVEYYIQFE